VPGRGRPAAAGPVAARTDRGADQVVGIPGAGHLPRRPVGRTSGSGSQVRCSIRDRVVVPAPKEVRVSLTPSHPSTVPPGYPREYERQLMLRDGREVFVRPILPGDAPQLAAAIQAADPETLHRRFLGGPPRLTPAVLTRLTTVDYVRRFAIAAADAATGRGVAIARYETVSDGLAEVAVVVDPDWRRVGLATALIEMLAEAAFDRDIQVFRATYLAQNRPVAVLLAHAGGRQLIHEGIAEAVVALDRETVTAAMRDLDGYGRPPTRS